ncbi:MAG: efflux RND transporter periplasmic adaptor subunit [Candidatus Margulisiibacteriota bacterium]
MKNEKLKMTNDGVPTAHYNNFAKQHFHLTFVVGFLSLIFLALGLVGCVGGGNKTEVERVKVTRGNLLASLSSTGTVVPRNRLEIKPQVSGRVEEMLMEEGQKVKKGQILAYLSSTERATLLDAARAKGKDELEHWQEVYRPAPVIAPLDGFIIQRTVEPGQSVQATDVLLVMADYLIVRAEVDESDIGQIRLGQKAEIVLDPYPVQKFSGKVSHIDYESTVVNNVTVYEVDIRMEGNASVFRSGMSATVNFLLEQKENVLLLPAQAVKSSRGASYVFIWKNGEKYPKTVQVEIGLETSEKVEIVSGVNAGDEVIIPTKAMVKQYLESSHRVGPPNFFQRQK